MCVLHSGAGHLTPTCREEGEDNEDRETSSDLLETWYNLALPPDRFEEANPGRHLPLQSCAVTKTLLQRVEELWQQRMLPIAVEIRLTSIIVVGGPGMVQSTLNPPAESIGLIHVAIEINRDIVFTHLHKGQGKSHALSKTGEWAASAVPFVTSMFTRQGNADFPGFKASAMAIFAVYPTSDSWLSMSSIFKDIPRPFGLLLQYNDDPRSQLIRKAAQAAFGDDVFSCPVVVKVNRYLGSRDIPPHTSSSVYAADDASTQKVGSTLGIDLDMQSSPEHCPLRDLTFHLAQPRGGVLWMEHQEIIPDKLLIHGSKTGVYLHNALIIREDRNERKSDSTNRTYYTRSQQKRQRV
ncbi:unnamed protein product [Sympodiomycopsis kandeliae]